MSRVKQTAVQNIQELRYKMAEKFAALENGEISTGEAKAYIGIASVIVNACKVEVINNHALGVVKNIDFLDMENKSTNLLKQ